MGTPAATALNAGKTAAKGSSTRLGFIRVADAEVDRELQRERLMESLGATYMILGERRRKVPRGARLHD